MTPIIPFPPGVLDVQLTMVWAALFAYSAHQAYMYLRPGEQRHAHRLALLVCITEFVLISDLVSLPLL